MSQSIQIIKIANTPLHPFIIINPYIPTHQNDIILIPEIINQVKNIINRHPNSHMILCGDFNSVIVLVGRTQDQTIPLPDLKDI